MVGLLPFVVGSLVVPEFRLELAVACAAETFRIVLRYVSAKRDPLPTQQKSVAPPATEDLPVAGPHVDDRINAPRRCDCAQKNTPDQIGRVPHDPHKPPVREDEYQSQDGDEHGPHSREPEPLRKGHGTIFNC